MSTSRRALLSALILTASCTPAASAPAPATTPEPKHFSSGTAGERFFPLVDQHMYHYATDADGEGGVLLVRVRRSDAQHGQLLMGKDTKQFEYAADGVRLLRAGLSHAYVLKEPLQAGSSWRGEHGGLVEVAATGITVDVPAGHYEGCLQTVEERGGDRPLRVGTTFCPEVGIVILEASSGEHLERAELRSYGPPVDLGPDGVRQLP